MEKNDISGIVMKTEIYLCNLIYRKDPMLQIQLTK